MIGFFMWLPTRAVELGNKGGVGILGWGSSEKRDTHKEGREELWQGGKALLVFFFFFTAAGDQRSEGRRQSHARWQPGLRRAKAPNPSRREAGG